MNQCQHAVLFKRNRVENNEIDHLGGAGIPVWLYCAFMAIQDIVAGMKIIDLTKPIISGMTSHITTSIVPLMRHGDGISRFEPPCEGFASCVLVLSDHCGTHMDAPFHFISDGEKIDSVSVARTTGKGVVLDVSQVPGHEIGAEHIDTALAQWPAFEFRNAVILLKTTQDDRSGKGLDWKASERLVDLGVKLVGTDSGGIDNTSDPKRSGHMVLLGADVVIIENLTNLNTLVGREFLFMAPPLYLEDATGSPVRASAIVPCPPGAWTDLTDANG